MMNESPPADHDTTSSDVLSISLNVRSRNTGILLLKGSISGEASQATAQLPPSMALEHPQLAEVMTAPQNSSFKGDDQG